MLTKLGSGLERPPIYMVAPMAPTTKLPFYGAFVPIITKSLRAGGFQVIDIAVVPAYSLSPLAKISRHATLAWRLLRVALARPQLLYIQSPAWFSVIILSLMPRNAFYVVNIHGSEIHGRSSAANLFWPFARALIRRADLVISPSTAFINQVVNATGTDRDKFISSPSGGVEPEKFFFSGSTPAIPTIGYVSRITQRKGWRLFLSIFDQLKDNNPNIQAIIVGDGPERNILESELSRRDDNNIVYYGAVPQESLQEIYTSMSVFVFTSDITGVDTLGLVSLEAQACGVPVVATDAAITREYINDGENGFLAKPSDVADFSSRIEVCLDWKAEKRKKIAFGTRRYETSEVGKRLAVIIDGAMQRNVQRRS